MIKFAGRGSLLMTWLRHLNRTLLISLISTCLLLILSGASHAAVKLEPALSESSTGPNDPGSQPVTPSALYSISGLQLESSQELLEDLLKDQPKIPDFPPNQRTVYKLRETMKHHWMLTRLDVQKVNCSIYMKDIGEPQDTQVLGYCGYQVYQQWLQGVCKQTFDRETPCEGLTLHYIGPINEQLEISITMPGAVAYPGLVNCGPWGLCSDHPQMMFGGVEPLAPYQINFVHIEYEDGQAYHCEAAACAVQMPLTNADGQMVTYYVTSSYGDDSLKTTFQYRNIDMGDGTFLFEVIGSDWDRFIPVGAAQWEFFPEMDINLVPWLGGVLSPDGLYTEQDYALLAGVLILRGDVSALGCADGGLLPNYAASACGVERAREKVIQVQNRFNQEIMDAANQYQVPPKLLKGLIGQESQFWNGWVFEGEYGYGMLTDQGADLLLRWHLETFLDLCIPAYGVNECAWGYSEFADYPKAYLRGLALRDIGTNDEFKLIAKTLAAAAGQTGQIIRNVTGEEPGDVMTYRELWLISLAMYHGGGGCVGVAIEEAYDAEELLTWGSISEYLIGDCQLVAPYPYLVTQYAETSSPDN
jgi:hypothetical protein